MEKDVTITEGLGLPNEIFVQTRDIVQEHWGNSSTVSEALEDIARGIQEEDLGTDVPLSTYEKRLILAGYITGRHHQALKEMGF